MIVVSSLVMGAVLWVLAEVFVRELAPGMGWLVRMGTMAALMTAGIFIYFAMAHVTGAARLGSLRAGFTRGQDKR
jgi:peptidoglycan biosynthesis protein MviN/MurJ (putative lipid II flippase)